MNSLAVLFILINTERPIKVNKSLKCGKCFAQAYKLPTHIKTHTGDKPYQCEVCGQCLDQAYNLTQQRKTTQQRNLINEKCVVNAWLTRLIYPNTDCPTQARNHINVMNVEKALLILLD